MSKNLFVHSTSYDPEHFPSLFKVEDAHFWFQARNRVLYTVLRQIIDNLPWEKKILEVGCGNGNVLKILEKIYPKCIGMDLFMEGLNFSRVRTRSPLVQADLFQPPFSTMFDCVCAFDVIEHLDDDTKAIGALRKLLKPEGYLIITVPAHSTLWSNFDTVSNHKRRYSIDDLSSKLIGEGFQIEYISQFMIFNYVVTWLLLKLMKITGKQMALNERLKIIPIFNQLMIYLLSLESKYIYQRHSLPLGTSLLAISKCR